MITDINSEDRLVQQTFAEHLRDRLGWESLYAYNTESFGPNGTLGRSSERDVVLVRDLRAALERSRVAEGVPLAGQRAAADAVRLERHERADPVDRTARRALPRAAMARNAGRSSLRLE